MIFATVGAQMPFDRMIQALDRWAGERGRRDVFAQIGPTALRPRHIEWTLFLDPPEFRRRVEEAKAIVAHAGMGSILTALEHRKPILIMPRRGDLGETRNDHQVATVERFRGRPGVTAAADEEELLRKLEEIDRLEAGPVLPAHASPELLEAIRGFIAGPSARSG